MITTQEDDFTIGRREDFTRWIAVLDDDTTVYQDDGRPGVEEPAWLRLKEYCAQNGRHIVRMYLQFRDHIEHVQSNAEGYYFKFGASAAWGGPTYQQFVVGHVENGILHKSTYNVPELTLQATTSYPIDSDEIALIMRG